MRLKKCVKCGEQKPTTEFYKQKTTTDGLGAYCKTCSQKASKAYRSTEKGRAKSRDWNARWRHENRELLREKHRNWRREWTKDNPEKRRAQDARHKARHPEKVKARRLLNRAVGSGKIKKQPCEVCGEKKVEGHHDDYAKPLEVRWLCTDHHERLPVGN